MQSGDDDGEMSEVVQVRGLRLVSLALDAVGVGVGVVSGIVRALMT